MIASLRGSDLVVSQSIEALLAAGLVIVEADGSAHYRPVSREVEGIVDVAIAQYAKSPDLVRRTIVAAANPNITAFADAFKLRKD
jgi:hypothetical protein